MGTHGALIHEGKAKRVYAWGSDSGMCEFEMKPSVGAFDDPKYTRDFPAKPELSLQTIANCFRFLDVAGIQVAYSHVVSQTSYVGPKCSPIPVEVIVRTEVHRKASILARLPHLPVGRRLPKVLVEYHLKTTGGIFEGPRGTKIKMPVVDDKIVNDPLMEIVGDEVLLFHPKLPFAPPILVLRIDQIFDDRHEQTLLRPGGEVETEARKIGLLFEGAWRQFGWKMPDLKLEFGIDCGDNLCLIDGVSNDEWRLVDDLDVEHSKQVFRDDPMGVEVLAQHYGLVADMTSRFINFLTPQLIIWRASKSDDIGAFKRGLEDVGGLLNVEEVTLSAHKEPERVLEKAREYAHSRVPTVIIACVGRSDALSPLLAANTSIPVIKVPVGGTAFEMESSLDMPSMQTPPMVVKTMEGAARAAQTILAGHCPILYMHLQHELEERTYYPTPRMHEFMR